MMKKITFFMLHLGLGGIETATINTCNALVDVFDIEVISFYKVKQDQSNKLDKKIKVKYILNGEPNRDEFKSALHNKQFVKLFKEGLRATSILFKKKWSIVRKIRRTKSGIIISTRMEFSVLLSKYGRKDVIKIAQEHQYHNDDEKYISNIKIKYRNLDYLIALTDTLRKDYERFLEGSSVKVELIPNMFPSISKVHSDLTSKNIISVGRFHKVKRYPLLMEVLSKLNKDTKLILVGDENGDAKDKKNIIDKINELNLKDRVTLPGFLDKEGINKWLLKSSIFVMTSSTEGLPMVLLEAMDMGLPCIAFETKSGVSDIIKDGNNGYVIKNDNIDEMVDKINYLFKNNKELKRMSKNAIETVKEYSKDIVKEKWVKLIDDAIALKDKQKTVMLISSTGGHLSELFQLKGMFKKYNYYIVTEKTKSNLYLREQYSNKIDFLLYGTKKDILIYPFKLFANCFISLYLYIKVRPKVIITTGAHTAGPMCCIGKIFGSKIIYIETLANIDTKTITGRIIYLFADLFIVQWEEMLKLYPKAVYGGRIY